ncbi:TnsD family Tn7-like transposition protein [Cupriavidus metallidurans]|uniref:Transposon transposition protein n=1 Tax=Cupriavidus metallidurans (strain ATCC 43123 / DSM 2839 / NBRC 102507 / CH34) TaxID=266264 RepID=Q1LGT2_CUPMC|nr:TnsD family Tn7-like transposition protein [Cupriavidus metallidurans]ABF10644.1 putative transposon transposition protein [Cupriavidus metallidurans CH34]QGS31886.1 transposase [Cupriavidus metallidurans]
MNVFVSPLYEDELLYSHCVRYLSEFPMVWRNKLMLDMFGAELHLSPHLPRNLQEFSERTAISLSMTKEEIFWRHSMYPFLCAYFPEKSRTFAMDYAYYGHENRPMLAVLRGVFPPRFMRWCPDCVTEDRARPECGEAYWRRAHQLPGVWQCEKHRCDLIDSAIPRASSSEPFRAADVVIPEDAHRFRAKRNCSSMEAMLRTRLVGLLNSGDFAYRPEHPNFREAAARSGFETAGKIDYPKLYEAFSGYWGDVLDRIDSQHLRTKVVGTGWLRRQFTKKEVIYQPVGREMLDIFFQDRFGIDLNELPMEIPGRRRPPVFYCPNPYAEHGAETPVRKSIRRPSMPGVASLSCECGFTALVPETSAEQAIGLADVIKVTRYGPSWVKECLKLRAEGKTLDEVAAALGVKYQAAFDWSREGGPKYSPMSSEQSEARRAEWVAILEKIAPGPPKLATKRYPSLHIRLLSEDREWFQETMKAYRQKYGHSQKRANWPARDEEYTEAVVAAAARLQRMDGAECPTVSALLKEAALEFSYFSKGSIRHFPKTIATLTRLSGKPWSTFSPYLDGGKEAEG